MPTIVEEFPFTSEGYVDAKAYAEIMSRTIDAICGEKEEDNEDIR